MKVLIHIDRDNWFKKYCAKKGVIFSKISNEETILDLLEGSIIPDHSKLEEQASKQIKELIPYFREQVIGYNLDFIPDQEDFTVLGYADQDIMIAIDDNFSFMNYPLDFTRCDACKKSITRHKIIVIKKDGEIQQLGGSCAEQLKVYKTVIGLHKIFNLNVEIKEFFDDFMKYENVYGNFIEYIAIIIKFGFSKKGNLNSTYDRIMDYECPKPKPENKEAGRDISVISKFNFNNDDILRYWMEKANNADNSNYEFYHNCLNAVKRPLQKMLGLLSYALFDFAKNQGLMPSQDKGNNKELTPFPLEPQKTVDIGQFRINKLHFFTSQNFYTNNTDFKCFIIAVNDLYQAVSFVLDRSKADHLKLDDSVFIRAQVKGISDRGNTLSLSRVKLK